MPKNFFKIQARYILVLTDGFNKKRWAYFLRHKVETLSYFKKFNRPVEVETSMKIKMLRSDRGGEFLSNKFKIVL